MCLAGLTDYPGRRSQQVEGQPGHSDPQDNDTQCKTVVVACESVNVDGLEERCGFIFVHVALLISVYDIFYSRFYSATPCTAFMNPACNC